MKSNNTKEIILDEALKLFANKGYEAVGVEEIAKAVGIKAPSLYKHYKNKRDIFDSIIARVNQADYEKAKEHEMPETAIEQSAEDYENVPLEKIGDYTKEMFLHWTKDEFFCRFRKLLTLEQYKSPEMQSLYQQYISSGPVKYMADIFSRVTSSKAEAYRYALDFYGPMYLLYSIYDGSNDIELTLDLLERHIDSFFKRKKFKSAEKRGEK